MAGETDLGVLLSTLSPVLADERYTFCVVEKGESLLSPRCWAVIAEDEGTTLVLETKLALERGLPSGPVMRRITLMVHSSLEAVGLTAAVSRSLAAKGISANIVAGWHHDHVFVPEERASEALEILEALAGDSRR